MSLTAAAPGAGFRHEALLYAGEEDFLHGTESFIRGGLAAGEPTLVVVAAPKIARLRERLGGDADRVDFADMAGVGLNPARIIPAWRDFVDRHAGAGRALRGIGEPIWAERDADELPECQRHEALLNVAFAGAADFWLLCPYDTTALAPDVLAEAERSHPFLSERTQARPSPAYGGLESFAEPFTAPLSQPADAAELSFDAGGLEAVRALVSRSAARGGLALDQIAEAVMAANEVATNSVRHGGGAGRLRVWTEAGALVCEVGDAGRMADPMSDRERPGADPDARRGLWLVNHLCDLVQIRSVAGGTVVRMRIRRR